MNHHLKLLSQPSLSLYNYNSTLFIFYLFYEVSLLGKKRPYVPSDGLGTAIPNQVTTQSKHLHRLKLKPQLTSGHTVSEKCTRYGLERIETVQKLGGTAVGRDSEIETTAKHFNHINNWWGRPSHGINESKGESLMSERLWHSDLRLTESEQDIASQK